MRSLMAAVAGAALLALLYTNGRFIKSAWKLWLPAIVVVAVVIYLWRCRRADRKLDILYSRHLTPGLILTGSLLVYLVSSAVNSKWFYFLDWTVSGGLGTILKNSLFPWFVLSCVVLTLVFLFVPMGKRTWILILVVMLFSQAFCVYQLLSETGGTAIYRDDHPAFMLRLHAFARSFPRMIYYDPFWNGGYVSPYIIGSGTVSVGTALWPLWRFAAIENVYTPGLAILFIVIVPLLAVFAVRISGGSLAAAFCAGTMAVGISRYFFLWLLHYGTSTVISSSGLFLV